jgi:proliferating cell nuclear antigen
MLKEPKLFRGIVTAVSAVMDTIIFHATPTGIQVTGMDPVRVMMVDMKLPPETFDEYECTEIVDLAVTLEDFEKILRRGQPNDSLVLRTDQVKKEKRLTVIFKGSAERTFSLSLHDMKFEELPKPKAELTTTIRLVTDALETAIKDAAAISGSEEIKVTSEDGQVTMSAEGDTSYMRNEFRKGSEALLDLESKDKEQKAVARYSIEYLGHAVKAKELHDTVLLQYATDLPMRITFQLEKGGEVSYFLAPRREAE